jgi:hypothetical protein
MILEAISRLINGGGGHNTLDVRTIEVYFQKSAGVDEGDSRGIEGLEYRIVSGGLQTQSGRTAADGIVRALLRPGVDSTLELLFNGNLVAQYRLSLRDALEPDTELTGIQRRLRTLGYQLGHEGDTADGCDGQMSPRTDKAILDFQIDAGLAFDSIVGDNTRSALNQAVGGSAQP